MAIIDGTNGDDILSGTGTDDIISGLDGNDTLNGGNGNDTLNGGNGNDTLYGQAGDDTLSGGGDDDTLFGGGGKDLLYGGANDDILNGGGDRDTLYGEGGNDTLNGGNGDDLLDGGAGTDIMLGGAGDDTYFVDDIGEAEGTVTENAGEGIDLVDSTVSYTLGANVENLRLHQGTDAINGTGNTGNNVLIGNAGANVLAGGAGDDFLFGKGGKDTLNGGNGQDTLFGGGGKDTLTGGGGKDLFVFTSTGGAAGAENTLTDFLSGTDSLVFADDVNSLNIGDGDQVIDNGVSVAGPGGFAASSELVIITTDIAGAIDASSAAAAIGSATDAYAVGDQRLFAVDNGIKSAVYLFQAADAGGTVDAGELTLLGTLQGTPQTALADFSFIA